MIKAGTVARALALAAIAWVAGGASCSDKIVEPPFEVGEHRMVVKPFRDRLQPAFESRRGVMLAEGVTERLAAKRRELGEDARGLTLWWGYGGDWKFYSEAYEDVAFAEDMGWWAFLDEYN